MLLIAVLIASTTGASSGPDLAEKAVPVDLPIKEVMVFSDRARVTRTGAVKFTGDPQVLKAPDLPGAVMIDTVRVTASSSKVVRVETRAIQRERWSIDQVDAWIVELEALADQLATVTGKLGVVREELGMLSGLQAAPPIPEKDRLGKPTSPATDAWKEAQDRLSRRRAAARTVEHGYELEQRDLFAKYQVVQREVQKRDLGGFTEQKFEVIVIVDGDAGTGNVSVEYAVPGAFWKPAYDLAFDGDKGTVELKASGLVSQATGEDWPDVKMALSTALPGRGIDMPVLRTWTLGDDREYVPVPTARATPRTTRPFQPPAAKPRFAEIARAADRDLLAVRLQLLQELASNAPSLEPLAAGEGGGSGSGSGRLGVSVRGSVGPSGMPRAPMPRPAPPRPSVSKKATEVDFESDSIDGDMAYPTSMDAPSPPSMAPMEPMADEERMERTVASNRSSGPSGPAVRRRGLALVGGIRWRQPTLSDPLLPAVSAGGLDYVYDAPVRVSVPSQANGLRVPLAVRSYDVETFYEATPSLATTAYLKAAVKNGSKLPILAGPANVFVKRTFSGDAQLQTTGPGGVLELPLGADEDIRLTRTVVPATKTQGMFFGEQDLTDYTVKIEIGNYKKKAITVRVVDQVPKTDAEKIEVAMVSVSPKPQEAPDADGLLYWHVDVPPGAVKQIVFTYRITRPKGWRLSQ